MTLPALTSKFSPPVSPFFVVSPRIIGLIDHGVPMGVIVSHHMWWRRHWNFHIVILGAPERSSQKSANGKLMVWDFEQGMPQSNNPFHFRGSQISKTPTAPNQQLTITPQKTNVSPENQFPCISFLPQCFGTPTKAQVFFWPNIKKTWEKKTTPFPRETLCQPKHQGP